LGIKIPFPLTIGSINQSVNIFQLSKYKKARHNVLRNSYSYQMKDDSTIA